jgi:integrase
LPILKPICKQAAKAGLLSSSVLLKFERVKHEKTPKIFLTFEELQTLALTPSPNSAVKKAALFAALTGLWFSDLAGLEYKQIEKDQDQYCLNLNAQKTGKQERILLGGTATQLILSIGEGRVFGLGG